MLMRLNTAKCKQQCLEAKHAANLFCWSLEVISHLLWPAAIQTWWGGCCPSVDLPEPVNITRYGPSHL